MDASLVVEVLQALGVFGCVVLLAWGAWLSFTGGAPGASERREPPQLPVDGGRRDGDTRPV